MEERITVILDRNIKKKIKELKKQKKYKTISDFVREAIDVKLITEVKSN